MKIESELIPVNQLTIKACFRILTFGDVQDKCAGCEVRVARYGLRVTGCGLWVEGCGVRAPRLRILDFGLIGYLRWAAITGFYLSSCRAMGRAQRAWCIEQFDWAFGPALVRRFPLNRAKAERLRSCRIQRRSLGFRSGPGIADFGLKRP